MAKRKSHKHLNGMEFSKKIAREHMDAANPERWDGSGDKPESVKTWKHIYHMDYDYADKILVICYFYDRSYKEWCTLCELRGLDNYSNLIGNMCISGINSIRSLENAIFECCFM